MEFEVEFRDGDGPADIEETLTGVPTEDGFRRLNERVMSDPRFRAGLKILVDCSALNTTGLTNQEVQGLSEHMLVRDWDYPPAAVAIIAPDEETSSKVTDYRAHLEPTYVQKQSRRGRLARGAARILRTAPSRRWAARRGSIPKNCRSAAARERRERDSSAAAVSRPATT